MQNQGTKLYLAILLVLSVLCTQTQKPVEQPIEFKNAPALFKKGKASFQQVIINLL